MREFFFKLFKDSHFGTGISITPFLKKRLLRFDGKAEHPQNKYAAFDIKANKKQNKMAKTLRFERLRHFCHIFFGKENLKFSSFFFADVLLCSKACYGKKCVYFVA